MTETREALIELLKIHALRRGNFTLSSGKQSSFYLDARLVTLRADGLQWIVGLIDQVICEMGGRETGLDIHAVGGMAIGADPIVGAMLSWSSEVYEDNLRGFIVRKEAKDHGTGRLVEGLIESGMTCIIVEDVATTGASALAAADAVLAMGCKVAAIIAVVDRLEGASEACAARGIPFKALVTIRDLGITP